jgi:hypothetical protein
MDLLAEELPELTALVDRSAEEFFGKCEAIARQQGWRIDRRREYAGPEYDQLNLYLEPGEPGHPMIRMVAVPKAKGRLRLDLVDRWTQRPVQYDEYLAKARLAYARLFDLYSDQHGKRLRLGKPRRLPPLDLKALNCNKIEYAYEKLGGLSRTLALGEGDARERLLNAFSTFHVIQPDDLPPRLQPDLAWVYDQITRRPGRHHREGSVEATVRTMRNSTAVQILERLVDIADAVQRLDAVCNPPSPEQCTSDISCHCQRNT